MQIPLRPKYISDKGIEFYRFRLKSEKIFHMKNFYRFLYQYMMEEGFRAADDLDPGESDMFPETYYEEWHFPQGHMERRMWWRLVFNPELHSRATTRYRYYVDLNFRNLNLTNVEAVVDGRRAKVQSGEVEIVVRAYLKIFWDEIREHKILRYFDWFFRKRWYKDTMFGYRDDLRNRMRKLQDAVKDFMHMATYDDNQKVFHLKRGYAKDESALSRIKK
ncbi:hypothetical protein GOV08_04835 [Candidatus Woesearchaeota archaeon]|nr:hypothetical protein [Candidatus Woesearchaeota archaeon]